MSRKTQGGSGIAGPPPSVITLLGPAGSLSGDLNIGNDPDYVRVAQLLPLLDLDHTSQIAVLTVHLTKPVTDEPGTTIRAAIYASDGGDPGDRLIQSTSRLVNDLPPTAADITFHFGLQELPEGDYIIALEISAVLSSAITIGRTTAGSAVSKAHAPAAPGAWINETASTDRYWSSLTGT